MLHVFGLQSFSTSLMCCGNVALLAKMLIYYGKDNLDQFHI